VDGPEALDVEQGAIANCYVAAAFAAIAHLRPGVLEGAIEEVPAEGPEGRRTFEVALFTGDGERRPFVVNDDLLVRGDSRRPVYGRWNNSDGPELWYPIFEKAFNAWTDCEDGACRDDGWAATGEGGSSLDVFEAVLGAQPQNHRLDRFHHRPEALVDLLEGALEAGEPLVAYTHGKGHEARYRDTGLSAWHTYAVLGLERGPGDPRVRLYNPWGRGEHGDDGEDDGVFEMGLDDFMKLFRNVNVARDPQV
jgi:hypothetical protein